MFKNPVLLISVLLLVAGCSTTRQVALDVSLEKVENVEAMRKIASECIDIWPFKSGVIKGALGYRIKELPTDVLEAKEELDRLSKKENLSDYELGLFLGLQTRLFSSVVQVTLEKYSPNVVELLPLAFLLQ